MVQLTYAKKLIENWFDLWKNWRLTENSLPGVVAENVKFAIWASASVRPNWVTSPTFSSVESESLSWSPVTAPCLS